LPGLAADGFSSFSDAALLVPDFWFLNLNSAPQALTSDTKRELQIQKTEAEDGQPE
tara:strand:- start:66 stop:233 length:168 start_codon:yes stop_codon:yes gene_type:complete